MTSKPLYLALLSLNLMAQTKAPTVSDAQRAKLFKAELEYSQAQTTAQQAQQIAKDKGVILQQAVDDIKKTCGKDFTPNIDKEGNPECKAVEVKK